ncbi:MAG: hypothetical protein AAFN77_02345 [Planctomycetota bacterium]
MNCSELAAKIESLFPTAEPLDVARMTMLLCNSVDLNQLNDPDKFATTWQESTLRIQAAADQHAAVTEEVSTLIDLDPRDLSTEQVWVLIRAFKVHTQLLKLYVGERVERSV